MKYTKTIRASRNVRPARPVRATRASLRRPVKADDEIEDFSEEDFDVEEPEVDDAAEGGDVSVEDAATELLFEAEDVAELVAEVSGQSVDVTVDEDQVTFTVGEDEYTVTPEGDEEIVEESRRMRKSARSVRAGRQMTARRPAGRPLGRPAARRVAASRRVSATRRPRR